ncbi:MAG: hypothetical protein J3R72DRAFT_457046 [Linnemannia gamsii]|nr:MAG: hypothetical protein J3R72DRAFT_457046 [Linnemannia gamsii]
MQKSIFAALSFLVAFSYLISASAEPACCDVLVMASAKELVGLNCSEDGVDCGFSGQVTANCKTVNRLTKIGGGCTISS